MRYIIMQLTPFPGHWQPMDTWQLQDAEFKLKINPRGTGYHSQTTVIGTRPNRIYAYSYDDAMKIIAYWQKVYAFAQYRIIGHPLNTTK